jgi:hypothetical protein
MTVMDHQMALRLTVVTWLGGKIGDVGNKSNLQALLPYFFALVIARPEPENSILEIVKAFSMKSSGMPLVMLGNYD